MADCSCTGSKPSRWATDPCARTPRWIGPWSWTGWPRGFGAALPAGTRLLFWSPARLVAGAPAETPNSYWEKNVRAPTGEGLAVRVLFPQVKEVRFVRELAAVDPDVRYAVFGIDGRTDVFAWSALDSILRQEAAGP